MFRNSFPPLAAHFPFYQLRFPHFSVETPAILMRTRIAVKNTPPRFPEVSAWRYTTDSSEKCDAQQKPLGRTRERAVFQNQCKVVHKDLLAGTCPWCGGAIINGKVVSWPRIERGLVAVLPIRILIRMLKIEELRRDAADALGKLGLAAKTAVPALTTLLNDKDEDIRKAASEALKKIQEEK